MKIAVVLQAGLLFDQKHPQSIESVIRIFEGHLSGKNELVVLCDPGAKSHGDIETIITDPRGGRYWRNRRIIKKLKELNPDLIEVHQNMLSANQIATALPNIPCVVYRHAVSKRPKNWFKRRVHLYRYRNLAGFIFVSDFLKDRFNEFYQPFASVTHSVQNAIDFPDWLGDVDEKQKVIAFGGRAVSEKGIEQMCDALPLILERYADWSFKICAHQWARHKEWSDRQVAKLDSFGDRFVLRKDQSLTEVQSMLKQSAIALVPTISEEAFGLAALEAHVAGAAVVSSGRGGLREASGPHAEYLSDVNAEALVRSISKLIDNPSERLELARSGQKYALDHHVAENRALNLQSVRERIVETFSGQ